MKNLCSTLLQRRDKKKQKVEAVPKSLQSSSSSSSSMGDDAGPQSLWVALRYADSSPFFCSIVRLDPLSPEMIESPPRKIYAKYTAHLKLAPGVPPLEWMFSPPPSSTHDLYLLPRWDFPSPVLGKTRKKYYTLHGATFNCSTNNLQQINQPNACKLGGLAVTVGHHIYFMAYPSQSMSPMMKDPVFFERYDPANQLWEPQEPFPFADMWRLGIKGFVQASAVWDDTILLNLGGCEIWAYNVSNCKWYRVNVQEDNRCYDIEGEAFAIGNTIYALSSRNFTVALALSVEKTGAPGDVEYSCSFKSACTVTSVEQKFQLKDTFDRTRSLVDMGNRNICFVQSLEYFDCVKTQPIHVTHIKLMKDGEMFVTSQCRYRVKVEDDEQFHLGFCFSPPDCKTTALKPCETLIFNPISGTVSKQEDKIGFNPEHEVGKPVQEKEKVALPKQGRSIIVVNLAPDATARQLEQSLKRFGHLKRDMIQLIRDPAGKGCCAFVEFESATSRRRAIEASPIRIGGCRADILKLRRTSSTSPANVGGNVKSSGGGSSGKNHKRKR